jgi:hypothetical protein
VSEGALGQVFGLGHREQRDGVDGRVSGCERWTRVVKQRAEIDGDGGRRFEDCWPGLAEARPEVELGVERIPEVLVAVDGDLARPVRSRLDHMRADSSLEAVSLTSPARILS